MHVCIVPAVGAEAAQAWFIAGSIVAVAAGGLHLVYALIDTRRPTYFAPRDASVRSAMEGTRIRLRGLVRRQDEASPSMWRVWLGIHIGFGIGILAVGLLFLVVAAYDFGLVEQIDAIRPLAIAFSVACVAVSLRFFFYDQVVITGAIAVCFTVAAVLSA
jgi:hypothetical protein